MVCHISFITEREGRFYNGRTWVFPSDFIRKILFIQLLVMSQRFCLSISKVPDWTFTGLWFFNSPINPKKQKLLWFRMQPAWTEMKLLIKLFKQIWEMIGLLQVHSPTSPTPTHILMKTWGIVTFSLTQSTNI